MDPSPTSDSNNVPLWKQHSIEEPNLGINNKKTLDLRFIWIPILLGFLFFGIMILINSKVGLLFPTNWATKSLDIGEKSIPDSRIKVSGWPDFVIQVKEALLLLEEKDPAGSDKANKYIKEIVSVPQDSGINVQKKSFKVSDKGAFASSDHETSLVWLASIIVHDATHSELYSQGKTYSGKDGEVACLKEQLKTLEKIDSKEVFIAYITATIGNPESNHYW